jgi:hypothetical protein
VVSKQFAPCHSQCMSRMRSGYREGLDLVSFEDNHSLTPNKPFKLLLEEALERQGNEMMDNFVQILRQLSITMETPSISSHFGGATPFKVQVNFDIPLFKGQIDIDALEKWLSLLEVYFSVHNFSNSEKITFTLLKALPNVRDWWETYCEKHVEDEFIIFGPRPTWVAFVDALKEQYYPIGSYDD